MQRFCPPSRVFIGSCGTRTDQGADKIPRAKIDAGEPEIGPMVNPGIYTATLIVDGKTLTTAVNVEADKRVQLAGADMEEAPQFPCESAMTSTN